MFPAYFSEGTLDKLREGVLHLLELRRDLLLHTLDVIELVGEGDYPHATTRAELAA